MYDLHRNRGGFAPAGLIGVTRSPRPLAIASTTPRIQSAITLRCRRRVSSTCIANISAMSSPNSRRDAAGNAKRSRR
jgi:hypothetical protein